MEGNLYYAITGAPVPLTTKVPARATWRFDKLSAKRRGFPCFTGHLTPPDGSLNGYAATSLRVRFSVSIIYGWYRESRDL